MITQIYAIQTAEEALLAIEAGADYLGFVPMLEPMPAMNAGEISDAAMLEIMAATEDRCTRVCLSPSDDPEYYIEMARRYKPEVIHVTGLSFKIDAAFRQRFKALFPDIRLLQAILVADRSAVAEAVEAAKYADLLILDSATPALPGIIGASGLAHDRSIDREIIQSVDIPVIVAGGLDETNVEQVIAETKPFGVDTMTRTNLFIDGKKTMLKDFGKVRRFCELAHFAG